MTLQRKCSICLLIAFTVLLFSNSPAHAESPDDILIITNKDVNLDTISLKEVRSYFLKKRIKWQKGNNVIPINAKPGTILRKRFQEHVLLMTEIEEKTYWNDQQVRMGLNPPPSFSRTLKAVFKLRGSIGYVFRKDYRENVAKLLMVVPAK
ncbi:MAG: hypothetical protein GY847_28220 [Proteobacteria bacterium]|nr:hypothetical protein [Pseudomonadota bacterium]